MLRLDKYLSSASSLSRKESAAAVRNGRVSVNGAPARDPAAKVDENADDVRLDGAPLSYAKYIWLMLHKPAGYVSSTDDPSGPTVLELLPEDLRRRLFPCGRLDKNTTGLMLLTSDGATSHLLLSPKRHVPKTYAFTCEKPVTEDDLRELQSGVCLDGQVTLPCEIELDSPRSGRITLHEGRYHQIKLMFQNRCNKILSLHRLSFGPLTLDPALSPGDFRPLTEEEIALLTKATSK